MLGVTELMPSPYANEKSSNRKGDNTTTKLLGPTSKLPATKLYVGVVPNDSRAPEKKISNLSSGTDGPKPLRINISPNSQLLQLWDLWIGFLLFFFVAIITPFEVAFLEPVLGSNLFWVNRIVDCCFVVDMFLQPFVPVVDEKNDGKLVRENKKLTIMYLKAWFAIDLVSIVPFDIFTDVFDAPPNLRIVRVARLMKLAKLLRVLKSMKILAKYESKITLSHTTQSLLKFLIMIVILAHWGACVWYLTSTVGDASMNWVVMYGVKDSSIFDQYTTAFYWATMTLMTIGYGDVGVKNTTERFISIILMLISGCVYAYIVGGICGIFASMNQEVSDFQMTLDSLNSLLKDQKQNVSIELTRELRAYFHDCQELHKVKYNNEVLKMMSPKLQKQFTVACYGHWLSTLPFIKPRGVQGTSLAFDFVAELVLKMTPVYFPAAEQVLYTHTEADRMFVIRKGLVGSKGKVLRTNQAFGEEMIAVYTRRDIAMTLTFTSMMQLMKEDFLLVLQSPQYESIQKGVIREARWMTVYYSLRQLLDAKRLVQTFLDEGVTLRWELMGNDFRSNVQVFKNGQIMGSIQRGHLNLLYLDSTLTSFMAVVGAFEAPEANDGRPKPVKFKREVPVVQMTHLDLKTTMAGVMQDELRRIEPLLDQSVEMALGKIVWSAIDALPVCV